MKNPLKQLVKKDKKFKAIYEKGKQDGFYIHAIAELPKQWANMSSDEVEERSPYLPICSLSETERIISPSNTSDVLLKYRADSILSNIRITRTFERRALTVEEDKWTLTDQFNDKIFSEFAESISPEFKRRVNEVVFGTLFADRPNAYCVKTQFGPLIIFSEALYNYLYFLTISTSRHWTAFKTDVQPRTEEYSLLIAIRTMMLKESFDFEMDPRGEPPQYLNALIKRVVKYEMLFVIAHEFAHFLLGHLNDNNFRTENLFLELPSEENPKQLVVTFYNVSQKQEFEADRLAIDILKSSNDIGQVLLYAVSALSKIKVFESFANVIRKRTTESSHPSTLERREELLKIAKGVWTKEEHETYEGLNQLLSNYEKALNRLYKRQPSAFTDYGSMYLDQWRKGRPKVDRLDY